MECCPQLRAGSVVRPRILAVDDTPVNLQLLLHALQRDYEVILCDHPAAALEKVQRESFDLILLDVLMPQMDGFELMRRLRALPATRQTPVVFLTAVDDREGEATGLKLGAVDFIFKPVRIDLVRLRIQNILKMSRLSAELRCSEERLRFVMEATGEGVWDWHITTGTVAHNAAWCHLLGVDDAFLLHGLEVFLERVHPDDRAALKETLDKALAGTGAYTSEHRMRHASGRYFWVMDRGRVVAWDESGQATRMVGSMKNIDEQKRAEAEIYRLAFYDPLTELPNRRLLLDRLTQALLRLRRHAESGALMFLDMDKFKALNDGWGHAVGDALLIEVADRLRQCVRATDTVARLGGDEFVVLVTELPNDAEEADQAAKGVAAKVLQTLNQPYALPGVAYHSTPSIGLTVFADADESIDELIKRADTAMYDAKNAGGNQVCQR